MKMHRLLVTIPFIVLSSFVFSKQAVANNAEPDHLSLSEVLQNFDYNYTRSTEIFWSAEAYQEILDSGKNDFPFTSTRTTLFIENGLYMFNSDDSVNSGYYTKANSESDKMRHYRIEGGKDARDDVEAGLSKDSFSANVNVNDYYVGLHSFHIDDNMDLFTSLFEYVEDESNGYYVANLMDDDALVLKDVNSNELIYSLEKAMMYFTAPCYTNPILEGEKPFYTFKEARIKLNSTGDLIFKLYANEESQLDSLDGLFSCATITDSGSTTIKALNQHLEN
ncbi:MAG: hypothetical protein GX132_05735 [Erysipelotrichia bacterium]|jgi:hypothetical protein|nr:hypothetical protein [Erysipelotrichia bacterium]